MLNAIAHPAREVSNRLKSTQGAWQHTLSVAVASMLAACGSAGGDSPANDTVAADSVQFDSVQIDSSSKAIAGRPTLTAASTMTVRAATAANTMDFTISGPTRATGGYQSWTNQSWATIRYLGTPGAYRVTVNTTGWAADEAGRDFILTANNDAGATAQLIRARVSTTTTTTTPTTPTVTTPSDSAKEPELIAGVSGRPSVMIADVIDVAPGIAGATVDFQISGPQRGGGGYQSWTDAGWARVSYGGVLGRYRLTIDTNGWGSAETSRSFTLVASNDAGQTPVKVRVDTAGEVLKPLVSPGVCTAKTAPGAIKTHLVRPGAPVTVPANFMGIHRGLHVPSYMPNAYSTIPAPTYDYGYVRNIKIEVGGAEERGFWLNIEKSPGVYDWSGVDQWVRANAGHPIIWTIYGTPTFYQKYPGEPSRWPSWPGIASPPSDAGHAALKRFAQAVKARYGAQIAAFEVWNEPTLPWTGGLTSYNDRWSAQWTKANGQLPPFFSGSASDLANIAYTLSSARLGVPVLGAGFVDLWRSGSNTVQRFLNAPVTLPGGSGTGKSHIQAMSMHFYDYGFNPEALISHVDGYRAQLDQAGLSNLPIWDTESGAEQGGQFYRFDPRAPINVQRWVLIGAAKRLQSLVLFGHFSGNEPTTQIGGPMDNPSTIASLREAFQIGGKTICNAAVLSDGRVWVNTKEGKDFLK